MKVLKHNYKTSRDYDRLYELAKTQRIVCFVDYRENSEIRDVAQTQAIEMEYGSLSVSSRGITYVSGIDFDGKTAKEDFIIQCKASNLEYIIP